MASNVWGSRLTFLSPESKSPSNGINKIFVQTTVLSRIEKDNNTVNKLNAVRPNENTQEASDILSRTRATIAGIIGSPTFQNSPVINSNDSEPASEKSFGFGA